MGSIWLIFIITQDLSIRGKYDIFLFFREIFNVFLLGWYQMANDGFANKKGNMPKMF